MICPHCGTTIPETCQFCIYCGGAVAAQDAVYSPDPPATYHVKLNLEKLLGNTFELYKRNFATMCLVGVIFFGVWFVLFSFGMVTSLVATAIGILEPSLRLVATVCDHIFSAVINNLIVWYITLGVLRQCLYTARGGTGFQAELLLPPFMMYLRMVGLMILLGCLTLVVMLLPAGIVLVIGVLSHGVVFPPPKGDEAMMMAWMGAALAVLLVCMIPAIWISIRLSLAQLFIADLDTGVIDSLKYSWQITAGNFWMLFVASLVLGIGSMMGMFLCGVGFMLTVAILYLGNALVYLQLTGQPNGLDWVVPSQELEVRS